MMLFWALFDGIVTYLAPLVITQGGISKTLMGIIIGSSSIAGALFDFLMCRMFKNPHYRRSFLVMFAVCLVYPLLLWKANSFIIYMIAMAVWGVYFDLKNFGCFDFVARHTPENEHSSSFGVLSVFDALGYLFAPILVSLLIGDLVDWRPFVMAWVFLIISLFFFFALLFLVRKEKHGRLDRIPPATSCKRINVFNEVGLWERVGKVIFPVLILTLLLNVVDAFFWTVGPLFSEGFSSPKFAGFFMTAYILPSFFIGWFTGSVTHKFGKKKTAFISFLIGSLIFSSLVLIKGPVLLIAVVFLASCFFSLSMPAINGAYSDYIAETQPVEKEILGLEDFFTNVGYVIGPISAGFLADHLSNAGAFTVMGIVGVITTLILMRITPRKINVGESIKLKAGKKVVFSRKRKH